MEILHFLENIRIPVVNELMLLITRFGEETAFLLVAITIFWCVDKYKGYFILAVGFVGNILSQFMKLWFRIPRPWIQDPDFTILEQAREAASGYSFPSGHSQSAVGVFGGIAHTTKIKWLKGICVAVCLLVPFSRMYIGVHTPLDVLVGAGISLVLVFALRPLILKHRKAMPVLVGVMLLMAVAYVYFLESYAFPADVDLHNLESGTENGYTFLGCILGMVVVFVLDELWLHFPTKARWWAQIIKVVGGFALLMAIKLLAKQPLNELLGIYWGRACRYFLMVITAGVLWPLSFRLFSKTCK